MRTNKSKNQRPWCGKHKSPYSTTSEFDIQYRVENNIPLTRKKAKIRTTK